MDFAVPDLAVVLGRSVPDLLPAVDEARAAGVLAESGHGLGFRHPLIRAALYDEMPARGARRLAPGRRAGPGRGGRARRTGWPGSCCGPPPRGGGPDRAGGRLDAGLAGRQRGLADRPGARGRGRAPAPGRDQHPGRLAAARLAGQPAGRRAVPASGTGPRPSGSRTGAAARRARRPGRPAVDARAVPRRGRPVRRVAGHLGPGAGRARDLGRAPGPAAGAGGADAQQPRRRGEGGRGRDQRPGGGVGGRGQLGGRAGRC